MFKVTIQANKPASSVEVAKASLAAMYEDAQSTMYIEIFSMPKNIPLHHCKELMQEVGLSNSFDRF